jgi:hypothetical protein
MTNIKKEHRKDAIKILQFLTFSERPLTVGEAVDAIVVDLTADCQFNPEERLPVPGEIVRICSSLVSLTTRENDDNREEAVMLLQLAHFSVKEYLSSGRVEKVFQASMTEISARACITRVCLAYMFYFGGKCPAEEIRVRFPLAQYSARYWIDHARHAESRKDVQESILQFLLNESEAYAAWGYLFDPDKPQSQDPRRFHMASPLYYASSGGLAYTVRLLLEKEADVNAQGGFYGNALQAASRIGNEKIVQLLLEKGADVNAQGGRDGNALYAASSQGYKKIVKFLLEKGANVNAKGGYYGNPLQAASYHGDKKIVQVLLERELMSMPKVATMVMLSRLLPIMVMRR